eukprot:4688310-Ditylum_brightwellii.AAC.1
MATCSMSWVFVLERLDIVDLSSSMAAYSCDSASTIHSCTMVISAILVVYPACCAASWSFISYSCASVKCILKLIQVLLASSLCLHPLQASLCMPVTKMRLNAL